MCAIYLWEWWVVILNRFLSVGLSQNVFNVLKIPELLDLKVFF